MRIKCLWFSPNACIFRFRPHPHHFSKLNFISKIWHFYSASQCVPRRHKINTEVNERLLKNIGTHWNIRHLWFQQVPISFSLALDRFVAKFSKSGSYMGLVYQIAYTEKCLHFWWYLNSYNTVSNRQKKTSTTEASSMRPVVSTQYIKGQLSLASLRGRLIEYQLRLG